MFALLIPSISVASAAEVTSLDDIITAGKMVVACEAGYPPFEMKNTTTEEIYGFDPDIMAFIAEDMDIEIEYRDVSWDVIFTSLAAGNYDCVMSAVTITSERMESMDFTRWYYFSTQSVMVTTANPKNISTIGDVNDTSVKVGVQATTTSQWYLEDEEYVSEMVTYATITLAIEALDSGAVDVVLGDDATLVAGQAINPGNFEIVDRFSPEAFGIACQKGSTALVDRMNTALDKLLGTNESSPVFSDYYNETHYKWMNASASVDEAALKIALDSYKATGGNIISGASILSLIVVIPVATFGIILKIKRKKD
nr:cystine transporter subunit [Candidatus Prometheoarchaeum syntrophicum]